MTDIHTQHEFQHAVLEAFSKAVPGFRHAFMHSAEFHAAMLGEINLMLMRTELMTIGSQTKAARMHEEISKMERSAAPRSFLLERDDGQ